MTVQIIKDHTGAAISVLINYQDWLDIKQQLKLSSKTEEPENAENPLDWFTLTETSNAILNELIAYTAREELKEESKAIPNQKRLKELHDLFEEVDAINREPDNFGSVGRMREIIAQYAPVLKRIYDAV